MREFTLYEGDGHRDDGQAALNQNDLYFRHLLEKLPAGAYLCDPEGLITYYNRQAVRLWGREPRLNDPVDRFCGSFKLFSRDGASIAHDQCWMALALKNNRAYEGQEIIVERPNGQRLTALAYANPIHDARGTLLGAVNVLVDISEQKRMEEAWRRNEERFRAAVEGSLTSFFILQAERNDAGEIIDFVFEDVNSRGEALIGIPRQKTLGSRLLDLLPADREMWFFDKYRSVVETREPIVEEFGECEAGHVEAWFWQQVVPLGDGVAITTADVTDRKRGQVELEERLRQITLVHELSTTVNWANSLDEVYNSALDAICEATHVQRAAILLFDDDGVIRFKAWRRLSSAYRATVEGHSPWNPRQADAAPITVYDVEKDASLAQYRDVILGEGIRALAFIPLVYENHLLGKFMVYAGEPRTFSASEIQLGQTIANHVAFAIGRYRAEQALRASEEQYRILSATLEQRVEERTLELNRANEKLAQRNRELQDFAHVASHDLQEPLRKFRTFLDLLQMDMEAPSETVLDYIRRMDASAERMSDLIRALLALARVTTRGDRFRQVDLERVIRDVLADLEVSVMEADAEIEISSACTIEADPAQLRQLFQNLIVNALKFRRPDVRPVLKIHAAPHDGGAEDIPTCQVTVQDNGIGFEEKYLDRIFAPFQRLHGRSTYAGTGMGLAICRRIVERHGGSITATSVPGEGSAFVVTLPLQQSVDRAAEFSL